MKNSLFIYTVQKVVTLGLAVFLFLFASAMYTHAQTGADEEGEIEENTSLPDAPAGTVSCFDYYSFGSVQANLTTNVRSVVSGTPITFTGTIENTNSYPIVDGALFVKVFKKRTGGNDGNGPDVVDQFLVKGDISIPAQGKAPITFAWSVPSYALSGEYELATFFTTSRKFNLLGLSFTDDVVGNRVPFSVLGEQQGNVAFEKGSVKMNGQPYYFAAFPPRMNATEGVTLTATVSNKTSSLQTAKISWTVYQWDGQLRENVVSESVQEVSIPARGEIPVSVDVTDTGYPVYYIVGTLSFKDGKSIIGARFVREGVDRTRINFPGVTAFPLRAGQANTLFSCLHNSGASDVVSGGSLDLSISDREGNVIYEHRYDGDVTGAMMGIASAFTPTKDYDYFTLSARLFQNGSFVDEANLVYDCAQINPALCSTDAVGGADVSWLFQGGDMKITLSIAAGALLLVLWLTVLLFRAVRKKEVPVQETNDVDGQI